MRRCILLVEVIADFLVGVMFKRGQLPGLAGGFFITKEAPLVTEFVTLGISPET